MTSFSIAAVGDVALLHRPGTDLFRTGWDDALTVNPPVAATMRAAVITQHRTSDTLRLQEVPTPRPGPGELLVQVGAVGLNHLDVFARPFRQDRR